MAAGETAPGVSGPWAPHRRGAVSLSFDDGLQSHLDRAIPILDSFGLRGTFYLMPPREGGGLSLRRKLAPWRNAARAGHEIGNHSLTHPCSGNFAFSVRNSLEEMTLDGIERDVLDAERRLRAGIPGQERRSFAYPCYQSDVGAGMTRQSYVPVITRHFIAGRGRGDTANDPARCDLHYLFSRPVERMDGAQLIGLCELAASEGRWVILTFHGINEVELSVTEAALTELSTYLDRERARIWTAPVVEVAAHLQAWRLRLA